MKLVDDDDDDDTDQSLKNKTWQKRAITSVEYTSIRKWSSSMFIKEPLSASSTKNKLTGMLGQGLTEYFSMDSSLLLVVVYDTFIKGHDFEEAHTTDLHIYNLDAVPPINVVSNSVSLPLQMAERLRRVQPVADSQ